MTALRLALTSAAVLLAACGGPGPDSPLMLTCDIRASAGAAAHGECQEWRGDIEDESNSQVDFNSVCTSLLQGTVLTGTCPTENRVGLCTKRPSAAERVVLHYYYSPTLDEDAGRARCSETGGSFSTL